MALGKKTGGRRPGSKNKITKLMQDALQPLIGKAQSLAEQVLDGKLPCGVCHGKGKTKFQPASHQSTAKCQTCLGTGHCADQTCGTCKGDGWMATRTEEKLGVRTCQSCYGSGLERLSPSERLRAALELIEYGHAKRKAIEVTGQDGEPVQVRIAFV